MGHWETVTFIAGLRQTGVVAPMLIKGAMNGEAFLAYSVGQHHVPLFLQWPWRGRIYYRVYTLDARPLVRVQRVLSLAFVLGRELPLELARRVLFAAAPGGASTRYSNKCRLTLRVVQITTDGHRPYLEAIEGAFGGDVDYAMLVTEAGTRSEQDNNGNQ
jgi:hypothetical protein